MIRKTILGTLATALTLTATVVLAEGTTTHPLVKSEKSENHTENHMDSTSTRPLLRDRINASSTKMVDSACAKTAVDVRKASLVATYGEFTSTLNSALSTREDAIKSSFDQETRKARQEARTSARNAYKKTVKTAYNTLKTSEKSAMKTYASSIKACGGTNSEASDEASDGSIANSIAK